MDIKTICDEASKTGRVLIVDEGRKTGGVSEALVAEFMETYPETSDGLLPRIVRYCGDDTFIPLGPSWEHVLPSEDGIVQRAIDLVENPSISSEGYRQRE